MRRDWGGRRWRRSAIAVAAWAVAMASTSMPARGQSDLDAFMAQVLARRDENWRKLQQYILDEHEQVDLLGPGETRLWGDRREYTWFIRDGFFVRSPTKANGVTVPEDERRAYETEFLRRAQARERGRAGGAAPADRAPASVEGLIGQTRQPEFIDSAYFLRFKFESGRYALVGRETIDGRAVLRVEYYPARLFTHEQDRAARDGRGGDGGRDRNVEASVERMLNKVALVTLWVEPDSHQIVKYTFDNIDLDFLPGAWLLRIDDLRASMTMGQPFPGVWLPHDVDMRVAGTMAIGLVSARYHLEYDDYREATTGGRLVSPGAR